MKNAFIVHVEDGESDLCGPVKYFFLLNFFAHLLLFGDELVDVPSGTELHDDVENISLLYAFLVGHDVDVFKLFQQFDFVVDILNLLFVLVGQLDLLYHVVLVRGNVPGQIGVSKCS